MDKELDLKNTLSNYINDDNYKNMIKPIENLNYRNKTEYTIGYNVNRQIDIGIYYKKGSRDIKSVEFHQLGSNLSKNIAIDIRDWIREKSKFLIYQFKSNTGFWHEVCIRENKNKEVMLIFKLDDKCIKYKNLKDELFKLFIHFNNLNYKIISIYYLI